MSDADFNEKILVGLIRRWPALDVERLRDLGMGGAIDPEVLAWAADADRIVLSHDKNTMPGHANRRLKSGLSFPGLVLVPQTPIGAAIADLEILVRAGVRADFENQIVRLPL